MKIRLFLAGQEADTNEQSFVLMNYIQEELQNPTIVRNSYAQNVTLPGTPQNNKIFGTFFRLDRVTTGEGFNAMDRTPFEILDEKSTRIVSGYCQLMKVQREGALVVSYDIALYGGLGNFFYRFNVKDDGTPMTLADLTYTDVDGAEHLGPEGQDTEVYLDKSEMIDVLRYETGESTSVPDIFRYVNFLRFAPARNGKPDKFDTKKVRISPGLGVPTGYELAECATDKTEWEIRALRTSLQRPVLSVSAFIAALENAAAGDFAVTDDVRALMANLWLTLSMPTRPTTDNEHRYSMRSWFTGTMSPTALLLDIVKTFGLLFRVDATSGITLMTRAQFYADAALVDLDGRIDHSQQITIAPMNFDAKYYVWANDVINGDAAKDYADTYDKTYGEMTVNTGYEFSEAKKQMLDKLSVKSCIMVNKSSIFNFQSQDARMTFSPARYEKVTLRNASGETMDYEYNPEASNFVNYGSHRGDDVSELPELGKEAVGVLLFFAGSRTLPNLGGSHGWIVTDDSQDRWADDNNGGVPCWCQTGEVTIAKLPIFSRYDHVMQNLFPVPTAPVRSLDFAESRAIYFRAPNILQNVLYQFDAHWLSYITDRWDIDSKVVRCMVDLRGIDVGSDMFRRFYFFEGAVWALNKVENYDLGGDGMTSCEFVKVTNIENYR